MEITCLQMDVLISFYIENELTEPLRKKVEEHLHGCPACRAKYNIISSLFVDLKNECEVENKYQDETYKTRQYRTFKRNLSAYVDNELPSEENIKIKKYTINNKDARKDLENTYQIRKLMKDSFKKAKTESKPDFSKNILKQMNLEEKTNLSFNPLIKTAFAFLMTVLVLSVIILFALTM